MIFKCRLKLYSEYWSATVFHLLLLLSFSLSHTHALFLSGPYNAPKIALHAQFGTSFFHFRHAHVSVLLLGLKPRRNMTIIVRKRKHICNAQLACSLLGCSQFR